MDNPAKTFFGEEKSNAEWKIFFLENFASNCDF